jgi:hypothetical protein
MFSWSNDDQLRRETTCVDIDRRPQPNGKHKVLLRECSSDISKFSHKPVGVILRKKIFRSLLNVKFEKFKWETFGTRTTVTIVFTVIGHQIFRRRGHPSPLS